MILGEVLNDGGAELSELGIETSQNLIFHEAIKTSVPCPWRPGRMGASASG